MTNLDSIFKSRDITLPTKVRLVKAMVFPVVLYGCESWTGWISLQSKGLSSLLQHHSSKASILRRWAFFIVQISHPYMTTGKTMALTRRTFVGKVMSLLFNMLSTSWEELTHWKRLWCWERLKVGEGDDRGWDGWMASLMWWTWVWVGSGNWW